MEEESDTDRDRSRLHNLRRRSYSAAMEEENAVVQSEELIRPRSIVVRGNQLNSKKKLIGLRSHDSAGSSVSSSSSLRRSASRSVTRTPTSSATSRSSSVNDEVEVPKVFLAHSDITARFVKPHFTARKMMTDCTCRQDSLSSISARESLSSYSIRRQDSGYSISTCQSVLAPSSVRNSVNTLNASIESKLHQHQIGAASFRISERRHSDQTFSRQCFNKGRRRFSEQSLIKETFAGTARNIGTPENDLKPCRLLAVHGREQSKLFPPRDSHADSPAGGNQRVIVGNALRGKRSIVRQDSDTSVRSSRRGSLGPVTPKMLRRRFSEQLILEGGLGNEPEFDELVAGDVDDAEDSLTAANARRKVTLKRHYYPEGNWGYVVAVVAIIIHSICHGLQLGFGVLLLSIPIQFDKKISDAGKPFPQSRNKLASFFSSIKKKNPYEILVSKIPASFRQK